MLKHLKLIIIAAILSVATIGSAQMTTGQPLDWSLTTSYRVTGSQYDRFSTGSTLTLGKFTNVFGNKDLSLDLDAYGGVTWISQSPVAAFNVGFRYKVANEAAIYFGTGPIVTQGAPSGWGVSVGLSIKFN